MEKISLSDITYEQGLQLLMLRKQALDAGHIRRMPPAALSNAMPLTRIGTSAIKQADDGMLDKLLGYLTRGRDAVAEQWNNLDPAYRNVLTSGAAGAGLGALAGAGTGFTSGKGNYLSRALRGGLAGGAVGGSVGLAANPEAITKLIAGLGFKQNPNAPDSKENPVAGAKTTEEKTEEQLAADLYRAVTSGDPAQQQAAQKILRNLENTQGNSNAIALGAHTGIGGLIGLTPGIGLSRLKKYDIRALANKLHSELSNPKADLKSVNTAALGNLLGGKAPTIPPEVAATIAEDLVVKPPLPVAEIVPPPPSGAGVRHEFPDAGTKVRMGFPQPLPTADPSGLPPEPFPQAKVLPPDAPPVPVAEIAPPKPLTPGDAWLESFRRGEQSPESVAKALSQGTAKPSTFLGRLNEKGKTDLSGLMGNDASKFKVLEDAAHTRGFLNQKLDTPAGLPARTTANAHVTSPNSVLRRIRWGRTLPALGAGVLGSAWLDDSFNEYLGRNKDSEQARKILEAYRQNQQP